MTDAPGPTRVLHVFGQMNRGGAEMRTLEIMRNIDRNRFHLDFCSLSGKKGLLDHEIRELGGEVHYCKLDKAFALNFVKLLRNEKFDVVHTHVFYPSGIMLLLARIAGVPIRIAHFRSTHDGESDGRTRKARNAFLRWLIDTNATSILAVSKGALQASWTNYRPEDDRGRVVYNGIDADQHRTISEADQDVVRKDLRLDQFSPVFIHVGRFAKAKNHDRLIEIFVEVVRQSPEAALLLVGGADQRREHDVRELVKAKGLQDRVVFAGVRADVPLLLSISDCMIFPSLWEGLPGVVLEAVTSGIPVVGSDLPGIMEIAEYTSLVKVVPLADSNETWSKEILKAVGGSSNVEAFPSGTPFDMTTAVSTFGALWSGEKQAETKTEP